jgi:chitodextrinase
LSKLQFVLLNFLNKSRPTHTTHFCISRSRGPLLKRSALRTQCSSNEVVELSWASHLILHSFLITLAIIFTLVLVPRCFAAQVTLAWDKNTEPDIAGYKIHYGTDSGSYDYSVNVGNYTSCTISDLAEDTTYYFTATAYNTQNNESDFSEKITYTPGSELSPTTEPLDKIIIDNGDKSTFVTGTWHISSCPNPYGSDSLYSKGQGSRYTFETALEGNYVVALWWTEHPTSRCSGVPVEIYDGNTLLETIEVNQQADGGQWNELGEYSFNGIGRVAVVSEGGCSTGADAVEFASRDASAPSIYQLSASAGSGGSISPAGEVTVSPGSSATYMIQPNSGYHIADVKVDDDSVGAVTSYTFQNVSADHTITASFDADTTPPISSGIRGWRWWWRSWR